LRRDLVDQRLTFGLRTITKQRCHRRREKLEAHVVEHGRESDPLDDDIDPDVLERCVTQELVQLTRGADECSARLIREASFPRTLSSASTNACAPVVLSVGL